jgi:ABC-2 type transport system ATP-binding protein
MIKINELTKYYKKHSRGILDLSLEVKKGEIFGFIGPNGAGKSTTVRTLLNFIFPTSGTASVMDFDIVKDTVEIRKNVGYIPSEVNYYNDMYVSDFLKYSTKFYTNDFEERLNYLSERLELDTNKKIGDLSFGNKKKVAIVLAFAYQPEILILDEPTSGLDPLMQSVFFELLEEEKKRGATIFFSSHVLSDVQRVCDRVGIIKEGRLIKIETIEDILKTKAKNIKIISDNLKIKEDEKIINLKQIGNRYNFTYKGEISDLLKIINGADIKDLAIVEPTLEEIFMHYYSREDL